MSGSDAEEWSGVLCRSCVLPKWTHEWWGLNVVDWVAGLDKHLSWPRVPE